MANSDADGDLFAATSGDDVYIHLRDSHVCSDVRAFLRGLWVRFRTAGLADPQFLGRFPSECPQRIWEMRLACAFLDWGVPLVPSPDPGAGLDFGIRLTDGRAVWLEATCPSEGDATSPDRVSAPYGQVIYGANLDRTRALRYLNSISAKRRQFQRAMTGGLVGQNDGLVVAISGARLPLGDVEAPGEMPLVVKSLFGIGDTPIVVEVGTQRDPYQGQPIPRPFVRKAVGSEVDARLFCSEDASELSAVLFDPHHVKNCAEVRNMPAGSDLVCAHNPFARTRLPIDLLQHGQEFGVQVGLLRSRRHRGEA